MYDRSLTISSVWRTLLRCTVVPDDGNTASLGGEPSISEGPSAFTSVRLASDSAEQTFRSGAGLRVIGRDALDGRQGDIRVRAGIEAPEHQSCCPHSPSLGLRALLASSCTSLQSGK
ncbi:hypothetical protein EYF80_007127 [Liparis tanakae]|uniref:Uncharacterized protein n=1 Tax=Liparis tanakae TaxID=230148 RepID=A0A4Z2IX93_9TELE|nr:hypothetical protein EYF80_007127 [Liparis tanakae]